MYNCVKKYEASGSIGRRVGSGRPSKITAENKEIVEDQMRADDKTTTTVKYTVHCMYPLGLNTQLKS